MTITKQKCKFRNVKQQVKNVSKVDETVIQVEAVSKNIVMKTRISKSN